GEANDRSVKGSSEYVWALQDINFEVKQGEVLGIIGRNGAGKSTLLKILSRTTSPTTGSIKIKGRVASLLEVGTGFHPELTGRENIFLNGAILGMTKAEIKRKFDEIVDFAGVERYIDTPVKRYSSGMYVRLAFGVAAHLEPEILIVDEVLAVGDAEFQKKALGKMKEVSEGQGRTVLFVSHNMGAINQLCSSGMFLKNGTIFRLGEVESISSLYLKDSFSENANIIFDDKPEAKGQFLNASIKSSERVSTLEFPVGSQPIVELEYVLREKVKNFHVAIIIQDALGNHLLSSADSDMSPELLSLREACVSKVEVKLPVSNLNIGIYTVTISMGIVGTEVFHRVEAFRFSITDTGDFGTGKEGGRRKGLLLVETKWNFL
ncbi:MAG: ABC transporter ATP-binding protein, partial [Bacteroidetes bacterium]|nr:ABC transporter ATP-binding protein [Bacteroidota bacterium]